MLGPRAVSTRSRTRAFVRRATEEPADALRVFRVVGPTDRPLRAALLFQRAQRRLGAGSNRPGAARRRCGPELRRTARTRARRARSDELPQRYHRGDRPARAIDPAGPGEITRQLVGWATLLRCPPRWARR